MARVPTIAFAASAATVCLVAAGLPASAASADGVWMRSDGMAKVQFSPCGGGTCGTIVWLKHPDGPGRIGEQVFFGMAKMTANTWVGTAHNPEDGNDYDGSMTLSGNQLTTRGCALGGAICKTSAWSRAH